ncbi:PDZ domain-containing protein [Ferruginibacter paludis]|uniref:PDZ domain-containing protein n=1 Tax=Ferruginibacter paludis TaxID=1310417 RepID=UPI0025B4BC31|nr:PDZ domain-containing protein [Ferruginibacter paludis]MDN3658266.1 PDZ domain-containing protein [Ferruginibacter paludis]
MKKIIFTALAAGFISLSFTASAQEDLKQDSKDYITKPDKKEKKETQEIIIKSNGDKPVKLNVEIDGDKVTINGKPLSDFNDADVTINKRKFIIRDDHGGNMTFNFDGPDGMPEIAGLDRLQGMKRGPGAHRPFLGVTTEKTAEGAKIVEVLKESAAEKAGLKKDDIITKIGDEKVSDAGELAEIISNKKPKEEIKIAYIRDGKKKDVKAVLGDRIEERNMVFKYDNSGPMARGFKAPRVQVRPMPDGDMFRNFNMDDNFNFGPNEDIIGGMFPRQKRLGLKIQDTEEGGNVKVIDVEDSSAAQKAGLKKDDVITEINGQKISNTDDAREQLQEVADKSAYTIKAKRNGTEMNFDIKIPKKLKTANL